MIKRVLPVLALVLFCSHDMFLKADPYFFQPNSQAKLHLFNGTYEKSENSIDRDRMLDVSLLGQGRRRAVDSTQWYVKDSATVLEFETGAAGTWVAGVSTAPREIALDAQAFNDYLEHDGVVDMLEKRKTEGSLKSDARERYSKHVKAIFQVGDELSDDWKEPLGYPIEFIPLENPYELHPGHTMTVVLYSNGKPLANQMVHIGNAPLAPGSDEESATTHSHGPDADHQHAEGETHTHTHGGILSRRTDAEGKLQFELTQAGVWYLRTIYMVETDRDNLTHESNWATLTFAVGQGHSHEHEATHSHEEEGIPAYVFWVGSLILLGGLFLWFNRRK